MISFQDPIVDAAVNPVGAEYSIFLIQQKLSTLGWLEKIFGRVIQQRRRDQNTNKDIIYPEIISSNEPLDLMPNDNLASYCFFNLNDPSSFNSDAGDISIISTQPTDIIVWGNLSKIDDTKTYEYIEQLKQDFLFALGTSRFVPKEVFTQWDTIFRPFTLTDTYRTYLKKPFFGFRISGTLSFSYSNC